MSPEKHVSRKDLIRLARAGAGVGHPHLAECGECREVYEVLAKFHPVAGRDPLPVPPPLLVKAAKAIGRRSAKERLKELVANLVFDSWASPVPVGVRGPAVESNRRVHFAVDDITFELRAEKRASGWSFVAQCSAKEPFVLRADGDVLAADNLGVYQWQASRPPRHLSLHSLSRRIQLPGLKWKRTRLS